MRLLRKHARDFLALAFVALIGLGVGGYILSNQRFYPPEWVPVIGSDFVDVDAVLSNAQAVVPGQGQTVNIAGVKVGEIGKVTLENGRATVQMKIRRKYLPLYNDASILLRPKTGLKDMYLELDPGNPRTGKLAKGRAVPLARTLPDVNPDEFLSSLDADTTAYLRILLSSGAEAFEGDAPAELRQTFKRFEPTTRDIDKITKQLAVRRRNVRRAIHNFQEVATALGERDTQLSQFVDSSNANFQAIASQEGSLRRSLELLPATLNQTTATLTDVDALASQLGPALGKLRPGARALGPSMRQMRPFLRATTPVIKNEIRPFSRDTQPVTRDLRAAAKDLAVVAPSLTRTFGVLNSLVNALAYNPRGSEEGFLFWLAWGNHNRSLLYGTQDAHGPVRRGQVFVGCAALPVLETLPIANEPLGVLIEMLNAPRQSQVCPGNPVLPTAPAAAKAEAEKKAGAEKEPGAEEQTGAEEKASSGAADDSAGKVLP
ncbi:MAG TPA: MlaD family protein [Thermoleophilaceae bacterium]|nr:MlaD family protein [Thermoleophilaceae bacterium]